MFRHSARAWALTLFYFLSFGGFVALFLYLPKLLTGVYHLSKTDAGYRAAGFALLAVIARPVGGWLSDRIGAERVLRISFTAMIALGVALALTYKHIVPLTITCLTSAIALGLGTGAVFKLVAQWFPGDVGAGHRSRRRRRRARRVLPTAADGDRQEPHRQLRARVHPARDRRRDLPDRPRRHRAGGPPSRRRTSD